MTVRILVTMGTRPEIIKLGPVCQELSRRSGVELEVFWTGQHIELAAGLADLFDLKISHNGSKVMGEPDLAGKFSVMAQQIGGVLRQKRYDWVVVQGDTITAAAAAVAGFYNCVPVAHVEAGLRTGNLHSPWPEEFDRRVITLSSSVHFAPTAMARDALLREGVPSRDVILTGNTVVDALLHVREQVQGNYRPRDPDIAKLPKGRKLVLATLHRRETIGEGHRNVLRALRTLARDGDKVVALPVHLNPEVRGEVLDVLEDEPGVYLLAPLQYPDFVHLLSRAWTVVTDSGGLQEEAPTFGLQILITRDTTERPECVSAGFGKLVGTDYGAIVEGVRRLTADDRPLLLETANPFGDGRASLRIADRLLAPAVNALVAANR
ncbi:UDP-N-acetylglucosamine 2-epimerase (non-hydrolyzing) [Methylorubrum sp. B1-46]|jgi:UDP-N-acetylglucosamine 2-epimerase|uniref:non-hydrolyzing UDP-N-acetylglucosamine 2-epimerase n=1 Tax=Methylorubrum sp. B1-46 TaxID=2897334 RepID=UPI001E5CDA13|nr:UDP-N-acetylglucosamine 2-epimerase (non-hydrolyzing) [Methylorubrum sp. B1-46]UGB27056.1 UDP-N-acetylglucosamine 2-epimerase (non-hydrolyzing) [Methylorubrum sp. B1-46]